MPRGKMNGLNMIALALAGALAFGATGCAKKVAVRGNLPDVEEVLEVQPGLHDRNDVATILGTPSTVSNFLDRTQADALNNKYWYYIGYRTEQTAFLDPEVVDRSVLVVAFNDNGIVDDTRLYTLEDGKVINPVTRETPTEGRELTILQQLFGNIGRFPGASGQ